MVSRAVRYAVACVSRFISERPLHTARGNASSLRSLVRAPWTFRASSTFVCCRDDPKQEDCIYEIHRKEDEQEIAKRAAPLKALGAEKAFTKYDPLDEGQVDAMEDWYARGLPYLSEYSLTFGRHKRKRLDEVPDSYLVKYLIPRRNGIHHAHHRYYDPIVFEAIGDDMRKNPDMKSQAGRVTTKLRKGGIPGPAIRTK